MAEEIGARGWLQDAMARMFCAFCDAALVNAPSCPLSRVVIPHITVDQIVGLTLVGPGALTINPPKHPNQTLRPGL